MVMIFSRESKVYLHCDQSLTTPYATAEGDAAQILNYVSYYSAMHGTSLSSLCLSLSPDMRQ